MQGNNICVDFIQLRKKVNENKAQGKKLMK